MIDKARILIKLLQFLHLYDDVCKLEKFPDALEQIDPRILKAADKAVSMLEICKRNLMFPDEQMIYQIFQIVTKEGFPPELMNNRADNKPGIA